METVKIVEESPNTMKVLDKVLDALELAAEDGTRTEIVIERDSSEESNIPLVICIGPVIRKI